MKVDFKDYAKYKSVTDYCRDLIKKEDFPKTLEVYRGEMLCLTVDVVEAAKLDILENKWDGPKFVKYKDKTMGEEAKAKLALNRAKKGVRADRTFV